MSAIWKIRELRQTHHRIIWWMVDAGAIGKALKRGWQKECSKDLDMHRLTLHAAIRKMTAWGVVSEGEKRGDVILNVSLFERKVDRTRVQVKEQ